MRKPVFEEVVVGNAKKRDGEAGVIHELKLVFAKENDGNLNCEDFLEYSADREGQPATNSRSLENPHTIRKETKR